MSKLEIPDLFPWQKHLSRNLGEVTTCISLGRRAGKSSFFARVLMEGVPDRRKGLLNGYDVALFAPERAYCFPVEDALQKIYGPLLHWQSDTGSWVGPNGKRIDVWSLHNTAALKAGRGRHYGLIVIDECSLGRYLVKAWNETIEPTLADDNGFAVFGGTPKGIQNDMHGLWRLSERKFQGPCILNPMPSIHRWHERRTKRLEQGKLDRGAYDSEDLGLFVDAVDAFVTYSDIRRFPCGDYSLLDPDLWRVHLGGDMACSKETDRNKDPDWTAFVVVGQNMMTNELHVLDVMRGRWHLLGQIEEALLKLIYRWRPKKIGLESIAFASVITRELGGKHPGMNFIELSPGREDKKTRFTLASNKYKNRIVLHPRFSDDDLERGERSRARYFTEFEDEITQFPNSDHDDYCDALVYALMSFDGLYEKNGSTGRQWLERGRIAVPDDVYESL